MTIYTLHLGIAKANCYIVDIDGKTGFAVDIGGEPEKFLSFFDKLDLELNSILLTHGHFDHIAGVETVREATGATVYIAAEDEIMLTNSEKNLSNRHGFRTKPVKKYQLLGDEIVISGKTIECIKTPGHTYGSICYKIKYDTEINSKILNPDYALFTGDTLFKNSIGRTDFETGDFDLMKKSLLTLKNLNEDESTFSIYPGHKATTTLLQEIKTNPYMQNL